MQPPWFQALSPASPMGGWAKKERKGLSWEGGKEGGGGSKKEVMFTVDLQLERELGLCILVEGPHSVVASFCHLHTYQGQFGHVPVEWARPGDFSQNCRNPYSILTFL